MTAAQAMGPLLEEACMDIQSAGLLKFKAALFVGMAVIAGGLVFLEAWSVLNWKFAVFYALSIWASCRAYYFCFYVMHHYVDPGYRYTGLLDLCLHLSGLKRKPS